MGIIGGYLTGSVLLGVNSGIYFAKVESSVLMADVTGGLRLNVDMDGDAQKALGYLTGNQ